MNEDISYSHPLDVLKRFMPAPLSARFFLHGAVTTVETNDRRLVDAFAHTESINRPAEVPGMRWKLLRDVDVVEELGEMTIFSNESLVVVSFGPACLIGVDLERKELLAFIGGAVTKDEYQNAVVPVLMRLRCLTATFGSGDSDADLRHIRSESAHCG
jgi:hypothetical protein